MASAANPLRTRCCPGFLGCWHFPTPDADVRIVRNVVNDESAWSMGAKARAETNAALDRIEARLGR